ncbi:MAG: bifunctional sulfate adenylyltransferase/adenylylsulfate kinase [Planctomycetota bacterium]
MMTRHLSTPHGGELVDPLVDDDRASELKERSTDWASWDLTERQLCDIELLLNGGFSPLEGFMTRDDYTGVCEQMRLSDGTLWPIPITLDITRDLAEGVQTGDMLALRDREGVMLAALHVEDIWAPDLEHEGHCVYGTSDAAHPAVEYLATHSNPVYVGGRIEGLQLPVHYDYRELRNTPAQLREKFHQNGWRKVVGFQTRNPMHKAHYELTMRALRKLEANLLIHPVVGMTKPGDVDYHTRIRCYEKLLPHYPPNAAMLSLLPLAMRMGGPREAMWHALIRKNYGCTHFIVGRDHAGPGDDSNGAPFYDPYDAHGLLEEHEEEMGIEIATFEHMAYVPEEDCYMALPEIPDDMNGKYISGTDLRSRLEDGRRIPEWFSFPEVVDELRETYPPRENQGFTVFFTGLPSSGKSTAANVLLVKLREMGERKVTLLDGDIVRRNLSSELGFSKEHRDLNIRRIGFVASEITKNGGVAICAPIAPYDAVRKEVRNMIESGGGFNLVHVDTPVEVCEQRDRKGLYAKARKGIVKNFTGISDPYEEPDDAEVVLDTVELDPEECAQEVLLHLEKEGYIGSE